MRNPRHDGFPILELAVLTAILAGLGYLIVPCHWTSTWADREFTGWVVPVANRLTDGHRLYEDGLRSPMPPLPFAISRLLFGTKGIWISESALHFAAQALLVLALWGGLARRLPRPVPFVAALATIPVFFALAKTIAYDAIAQLFVALSALGTLAAVEAAPRIATMRLAWLATASACCLLSKQNTGAGVLVGVTLALLTFPAGAPVRERCRRLVAYLAGTTAVVAALTALMLPIADPAGMITDVVLTGSEPKGGLGRLAGHLRAYAIQAMDELRPGRVAALVLGGACAYVALRPTPDRRLPSSCSRTPDWSSSCGRRPGACSAGRRAAPSPGRRSPISAAPAAPSAAGLRALVERVRAGGAADPGWRPRRDDAYLRSQRGARRAGSAPARAGLTVARAPWRSPVRRARPDGLPSVRRPPRHADPRRT